MCRTYLRVATAPALMLAAMLAFPSSQALGQSCQASAALPIFPQAGNSCAAGLIPGQILDTVVTINNTSSTLGFTPVSAILQGTVTVALAAGDTFVPVGGNGCVAKAAGVAGCVAGPGNTVLITMGGGVPLAAGAALVQVATIRLTVGGPAAPVCDQRLISAATSATGMATTDALCTPQVNGGAQGQSVYNRVQCVTTNDCTPSTAACGVAACVNNACVTQPKTATTACRASAGACDVAESCDGINTTCPADTFAAATTECRASAGVCDVAESCTGSSAACPANTFAAATTECRASAGVCDVAESCTGSNAACPANGFAAATTSCRAATGACDVAESCDGVGNCPADGVKTATTECRASAGVCDVVESCDGTNKTCPADGFKGATTECRAAIGVCDVAESCTGAGAACPGDGFAAATTVCRVSAGVCDVAESCTGLNGACPADGFLPSTTSCDANLCQSCTGSTASCPTANLCNPLACRTPGYWAQHAGIEKPNSTNQTSNVLASLAGQGTMVCGQPINPFLGQGNTGVDHKTSPIEALCMPNGGDFRSQVVFHMTAAKLNCAANGYNNCVADPLFGTAVADCENAIVCAPTTAANRAAQTACVARLDCLNNGGVPGAGGFCGNGTCNDNGAACTSTDKSRCGTPATAVCNPAPNCHQLNFPNFPDSPAGSQDACKAATQTACTIFGGCAFNP